MIARRAFRDPAPFLPKPWQCPALPIMIRLEISVALADHKADVNARTGKGRTPIMFAAERAHTSVLRMTRS